MVLPLPYESSSLNKTWHTLFTELSDRSSGATDKVNDLTQYWRMISDISCLSKLEEYPISSDWNITETASFLLIRSHCNTILWSLQYYVWIQGQSYLMCKSTVSSSSSFFTDSLILHTYCFRWHVKSGRPRVVVKIHHRQWMFQFVICCTVRRLWLRISDRFLVVNFYVFNS